MKILHLYDHQLFNEGLNAVFSQSSTKFQIISVTNAKQALDALTQNSDVELILIDLNMPDLNGLAFIDSINERNIYIPYIVLSASEEILDIRQALQSGASGFIPKAYNCQRILEIIAQVMLGGAYVPDNILAGIKSLPETSDLLDEYKTLNACKLRPRQFDVLKLIRQVYSNEEIVIVLNLRRNTIKMHLKTLFTSFQVSNRLECVLYAERIGLL
jgi:DNA-binding NarL/FixJ family response regulator